MKQRVISGIFIVLVTVIAAYFGGVVLKTVMSFVALYGTYEFLSIRKPEFNYFLYVVMVSAISGMMYLHKYASVIFLLELIILLGYGVFTVKETFDDLSSAFLMSVMLGYALYFFIHIQAINKWLLGYVIIVSYIADTFAYFIGVKFGKHKLNNRVSPKKTIEGSVGGWVCATLISFAWAAYFRYFGMPVYIFVLASLFLPLVSEIGDLVFSLIKRHYGAKDFSNLIPGHGGILDRLDSNIFCIILFGALLTLFKVI